MHTRESSEGDEKERSEGARASSRARPPFLRSPSLLVLVGLAALGTFIVTPRPTMPRVLPLPSLDSSAQKSREAEERARAAKARAGNLPHRARAIGERFRRLNLAQSSQHPRSASLSRELREETARLLHAGGTEELLELRALQAELFLDEVRRWAKTGELNVELLELSADFSHIAETSWLDSNRRLLLDDDDLRLLFRIRWGQLTGVHRRQPFGPDLEEFRRYYLRMLEHPPGGRTADPIERALLQIPTVLALGELDPDYPKDLAHGILLLKTGQAEAAAQSLTQHLTSSPDGPWAQLAQNYRLAAIRASTPF